MFCKGVVMASHMHKTGTHQKTTHTASTQQCHSQHCVLSVLLIDDHLRNMFSVLLYFRPWYTRYRSFESRLQGLGFLFLVWMVLALGWCSSRTTNTTTFLMFGTHDPQFLLCRLVGKGEDEPFAVMLMKNPMRQFSCIPFLCVVPCTMWSHA